MKGTNHDIIQVIMTVLGRCEAQTVTTNAYSTKSFGAEVRVCRPAVSSSVVQKCVVLLSDRAALTECEADGKSPSVQLSQTVRTADPSGAPVTSA
jgi:hypothetical protein